MSPRSARCPTPLWVTIVSLWSSLEGSILFWGFVLGIYIAAATYLTRKDHEEYMAYSIATWLGCASFFSFLIAGPANPFLSVAMPPTDGPGPNPLLQNHVLMIIHPPFLYLGYVGMTIPFGFATAALLRGRLGLAFLKPMRTALMLPWIFLTIAIMLGGWWAYEVLGWGGYWAWDPVENASLLPWLTATAALHSARGDGAPRSPQGLDRDADSGELPPHDPGHVHDSLGRVQLRPLVHPELHRADDPCLSRRRAPRFGGTSGHAHRLARSGRAHRRRSEPRGDVPPQQPSVRPVHLHRADRDSLPARRGSAARQADERRPAVLRQHGRPGGNGSRLPARRRSGVAVGTGIEGTGQAFAAAAADRRRARRNHRLRARRAERLDAAHARLRRIRGASHALGDVEAGRAADEARRLARHRDRAGAVQARTAALRVVHHPRRCGDRHRGHRRQQHDAHAARGVAGQGTVGIDRRLHA